MISRVIVNGLNDEFRQLYMDKLMTVLALLPSDSTTRTSIDKISRGYIGVLDINSSNGRFLGKAIKKDPYDLVLTLFVQVFSQMRSLKKDEFFDRARIVN